MIGQLPKSLTVSGKEYKIRSDFRVVLLIFEAYDAPELNDHEKLQVLLECLYEVIPDDVEEAYKQALWFVDGGDMPKSKRAPRKLMDWIQDESLIFPAVNKVAGYETRSCDYLHWWSFLGLFNEIGEGLYATVMNIRLKKSKKTKLEKYEMEFYREHKELVDLRQRYSAEEQAEIDRFNKLLDGD